MKNYNIKPPCESTINSSNTRGYSRLGKKKYQNKTCRLWLSIISTVFVASCAFVSDKSAVPEQAEIEFVDALLPVKKDSFRGEFYPAYSLRAEHAGRVSLAYSVNSKGRPEKISVLFSDYADLAQDAKFKLMAYQLELPPGWVESGGPSRRYRLSYVYVIVGLSQPPASDGSEPQLVITARRVPAR